MEFLTFLVLAFIFGQKLRHVSKRKDSEGQNCPTEPYEHFYIKLIFFKEHKNICTISYKLSYLRKKNLFDIKNVKNVSSMS